MPGELSNENATGNTPTPKTVALTDPMTTTTGGDSVCKLTFNVMEELQGDNSLEPGEVITPPHGSHTSKDTATDTVVSTKKVLKDALNKTMKKPTQINTATNLVEQTESKAVCSEKLVENRKLATGNNEDVAAREEDDSEGLYSGSDSSSDEQKIDKNAVRYELHPKLATQPLQPPPADKFNTNLMPGHFNNFMPRMPHFMPRGALQPRGNMRGGFFRPSSFHGHLRPYGNTMVIPRQHIPKPHTPPPLRGHSPIRAPKSSSKNSNAAGNSTLSQTTPLVNAVMRTTRTGETTNQRSPKEHLLWTSVGKTSINWSLGTKLRNRIDDIYREYNEDFKSKKKNREITGKSEEKITNKQEDKTRNRSHRSHSDERSAKKKVEKKKSETHIESVVDKSRDKLGESKVDEETTKHDKKAFDIFAESPPRLSAPTVSETKGISLQKIKLEKLLPKEKSKRKEETRTRDKRSRTPPLTDLIDEKAKVPLMEAIAVQTRIDKLLQDSDLELEALLANKDKFLRKTKELKKHSNTGKQNKSKREYVDLKKETTMHHSPITGYTPEGLTESTGELVRIKTEPLDSNKNNKNRKIDDSIEITHDLNRPIKRESSPWEEEETIKVKRITRSPLNTVIKCEKSPWEVEDPMTVTKIETKSFENATTKQENPFKQTVLSEHEQRMNKSTERYTKGFHARVDIKNKSRSRSPRNQMDVEMNPLKSPSSKLVQTNHLDATCDSLSKSTNGSKTAHSPDTDDYIDNWENDDSTAACDGSTTKVFTAIVEDGSSSNNFWNPTSTPPTTLTTVNKSTTPTATPPQKMVKQIIDMQDMYDKFLKSIKMNTGEVTADAVGTPIAKKSESPASTDTTDSSNSSIREAGTDIKSATQAQVKIEVTTDKIKPIEEVKKPPESEQQVKNNVSKDLKRLKTLEGNLARIQMMRENYDSGDELCEELVKMESLFLAEKSAIMEKYKKNDLKLGGSSKKLDTSETDEYSEIMLNSPKPETVPNKIFDANREAIKLKLSPMKLTRKAAIFEKDDGETTIRPTTHTENEPLEKFVKPAKEIAIVKPIMDTKSKRQASPPRRVRRRSSSRNRRSNSHSKGHSLSPRRRRPFSPARSRLRFRNSSGGGGGIGIARRSRSRSYTPKRSFSRSHSRSRSPNRRRRPKFVRKRNSYSPPPPASVGPRSPPLPSRRRSYSRERYSRSPLPFKPPSPPMRRSCSSSPSHSPRRTRLSRSRSRSPYTPYYNHNSQDAASYYYDMPHNQIALDTHINIVLNNTQNAPNPDGSYGGDYASYSSYMESAYINNETEGYYSDQYHDQFYSNMPTTVQSTESMPPDIYYNGFDETHGLECTGADPTVLKELPKAPMPPVAVQKGNVLEIVPSSELPIETVTVAPTTSSSATVPALKPSLADKTAKIEAKLQKKEAKRLKKLERKKAIELAAKSGKKKVNFEDRINTNNASDDEDQNIIERAVQRAIKKYQAHSQKPEAKQSRCIAKALQAGPLPLPPPVKPGTQLVQPKYLIKKPVIRYYHFDTNMGIMYFSYNRIHKPLRFDPKCMPMFFNAGKYSGPPPPNNVAAALKINGAMTKEIIIPSHPPPPLGHPITSVKGQPHVLTPAGLRTQIPQTASAPIGLYSMRINNYMRVRQPHFVRAHEAHPIPVLGLSYNLPPTGTPASRMLMTPPPLHSQQQQHHHPQQQHHHPQQQQQSQQHDYTVMSVPPPAITPTRTPSYIAAQQPTPPYIQPIVQPEYLTTPPDPMLTNTTISAIPPIPHFNVTPIPTITEIKPVEMLPATLCESVLPDPVVMQKNEIGLNSITVATTTKAVRNQTELSALHTPTTSQSQPQSTSALSLVKT